MSTSSIDFKQMSPELQTQIDTILGLRDAFDKDNYHVYVTVDGSDLVIEVFDGIATDAPIITELESDPMPTSESTDEVGARIRSNYDTMLQLLKTYKTFPNDTQLDQIHKIVRPVNKSIADINRVFLTKIGKTKGIKIDKTIYREFILNRLLNEMNAYFADYYLHSTGRQVDAPTTNKLLSFLEDAISARERNKVNTSDYRAVLNEIKTDPQVQNILTELNKQTGNSLIDVLNIFNPSKTMGGGTRRHPLRQTRKLCKSNK